MTAIARFTALQRGKPNGEDWRILLKNSKLSSFLCMRLIFFGKNVGVDESIR